MGLKLEVRKFQPMKFQKEMFPIIVIYIDNYNTKKLLGYKYSSADEEESKKVLDYLKSKYKGYKTNTNKVHGDFYFWDLQKLNKWINMIVLITFKPTSLF